MKLKNRNSGVTLIALVITIIVLLILAGLTISWVIGDNGIASRAVNSKEKTETAQSEEDAQLSSAEAVIDNLGNNGKSIVGTYTTQVTHGLTKEEAYLTTWTVVIKSDMTCEETYADDPSTVFKGTVVTYEDTIWGSCYQIVADENNPTSIYRDNNNRAFHLTSNGFMWNDSNTFEFIKQ
jgi:type II secretory pathway pseudopilin PulG